MTDWIPWHGGECPLSDGTLFECKLRNGAHVTQAVAPGVWQWRRTHDQGGIVSYRLLPYDADGLPTDHLERIAFALGMTAEALRPLLRRLHDAGFEIIRKEAAVSIIPDGYPTDYLVPDMKAAVERSNARDRRYYEGKKMRESRIYTLLGRLHELAAEGKPMDAGEVRFTAAMLPVEKLT